MDQAYDFSGWATRNDLACADGRTIRRDAFKHCDGKTVPLVWNHRHDEPTNILGHALLENRTDGVYAYCYFNETESGQAAKALVQHGDIESLSIYANGLKQTATKDVMHGDIREVSLVVAGANPGAFIDFVDMAHSEEGTEEEVIIGTGEGISLYHADEKPASPKAEKEDDSEDETVEDVFNTLTEKQKTAVYAMIGAALEDAKNAEAEDSDKKEEMEHSDESEDSEEEEALSHAEDFKEEDSEGETLQDVFDTLTEKQKTVVYAMIGAALEEAGDQGEEDEETPDNKSEKSEGGQKTMKHNVFEAEENKDDVLIHSEDRAKIIELAKSKSVGSLKDALQIYVEQNELAHGIDNIDRLFPDFEDVRKGAPELVTRDQGWVNVVMQKVSKSPFGRIRTRQVDTRVDALRGRGYQKTTQKALAANTKALNRTTDPQTIYVLDALNRDDILDITDFDVVEFQYQAMREILNEEIAIAIMIGDGRGDSDPYKISEDHVRSIWNDDEAYTVHYDVDIATIRTNLQGTNTGANFGENYVYAEAIIEGALYAREDYKGTGKPDFFCTPHLVNKMMMARDLNGRRIYNSEADLAAALNVANIYTAEQFENLTRTDVDDASQHKLLGLFVNLADYTVGSVKGGEITRFNQFDIDFNKEKYLIETRISGALTRAQSAIALEEPVTQSNPG